MFTLVVRFDLPDASAARAFDELTAAAVPLIRTHEPGTLVYETYAVEGEPLARVFYEVYRDREAHAEHERQPHTATFLTAVRALVTQTRVEYLSPAQPATLTSGRPAPTLHDFESLARQAAGDEGSVT